MTKTSLLKRGFTAFIAMLVCLSTFIGLGTTTAYAAGEQAKVYLISFPRAGDENSGGEWGHSSLNFMNGWTSGQSRYTTIRAMDSYSGNACYCIEPGVPQDTGDMYTKWDENFWDNYPSTMNHTISPDEIKTLIGRIFQYGYTGTISTDWKSQNEGGDSLAHLVATQLLVWETVVGERDSEFNHVDTGGCNAILDQISAGHPLYSQIMGYYNSIAGRVKNHSALPSFMRKTLGNAQTFELEWDGSQYKAVLTDDRGVVGNYHFSSNEAGVQFSVNGNQLIITASKAPSGSLTITAEKEAARRGVITWTDGDIGGGVQDVVTYAQTVSDPVKGFVNLKVSYGSAKIVKTSEDGKVDNISFTITGNGIDQTVKTNSRGEIQIDNLMPGVYTVTEQAYDRYEPQEVRRVTVVAGQTATVNFNNKLKRGDIEVIKSSEDSLNEGVTFHLYGTSLSGIVVDEYAVTDKDGIAKFEDVLISGTTPYTIEEVDTAVRYVVPADQTTPVKWNEVTSRSFANILKKFVVTVTKSDSETGAPQGNACLSGAKYGIFKGDQLIDEYFTDQNGQFTTKEYVCDSDWTIRELEPSEGYLLDSTVYKVGAEPELYTVEHNQTANDVLESVIKGNIAIVKHSDSGSTQVEVPEEGAEFEVYLKSAGSYDAADPDERDILVCDADGFAKSKDLPYGEYVVEQTKGWDGRELMPAFMVNIAEHGKTYKYLINNAQFQAYLKIVKTDAETGKNIPYAGAVFEIYDPEGNLVEMTTTYPEVVKHTEFATNAEGWLITPEVLNYGTGYYLVEKQAPEGYVLNTDPVYFDVTAENATSEDGITVVIAEKPNMPQKGKILLTKTGEVFHTVEVQEGKPENRYKPVYAEAGLAVAVFEIRASVDVRTPDGTLRYSKGEVVDTLTTLSDGTAESAELYLGKYEIIEIKAPYGMVKSEEIITAELVYAGQEISVTSTSVSLNNERQKVEVKLYKDMEKDELFQIGSGDEILHVYFALYAAEDLTAADGTIIPANGLIEIAGVQEDGTLTFSADLPIGSYYVKEYSTNESYLISDETYSITFAYDDETVAVVKIEVNDGEAILNRIIRGSIKGVKVDEAGEPLPGAVFGLFRADCTEFTEANALLTAKSGEDGGFLFENVPYGIWLVRELSTVEGYALTEEIFEVQVSENGALIELGNIENKPITGTVQTTKVDKNHPENRLTGAVFLIYLDANGNGVYDPDTDTLYGTMEELEKGMYSLSGLPYGGYFLYEETAPEGYLKDDRYYFFEIRSDGEIVSVENEAGIGFVNQPETPDTPDIPQTGDNSNIWLWICIAGASLGAGVLLIVLSRKRRKEKN